MFEKKELITKEKKFVKKVKQFITQWRKKIKKSGITFFFPANESFVNELFLTAKDQGFLKAKETKISIENKIEQIKKNIEVLLAFLHYDVEILNVNPYIQQQEYILHKTYHFGAVPFNTHLTNRLEIMSKLSPVFSPIYQHYYRDAEGFDAYVENYIRKNFIVKMDGKDVTDGFLSFFTVLAFFISFKREMRGNDLKEINALQNECRDNIEKGYPFQGNFFQGNSFQGYENTFAFTKEKVIKNSLASLIFDGENAISINEIDLLNNNFDAITPESLSRKAFFNREVLRALRTECLMKEGEIFAKQKMLVLNFIDKKIQLYKKYDKKNPVPLASKIQCILVNVDKEKIKDYKCNYEYMKQCIRYNQSIIMNYLEIRNILPRDHNNNVPYEEKDQSKVYHSRLYQSRLYQLLLLYLTEKSLWKKVVPSITDKQHDDLDALVSSRQDNDLWNKTKEIIHDRKYEEQSYIQRRVKKWIDLLQSGECEPLRNYYI